MKRLKPSSSSFGTSSKSTTNSDKNREIERRKWTKKKKIQATKCIFFPCILLNFIWLLLLAIFFLIDFFFIFIPFHCQTKHEWTSSLYNISLCVCVGDTKKKKKWPISCHFFGWIASEQVNIIIIIIWHQFDEHGTTFTK